MATVAEKIAAGDQKPTAKVQEAAEEVKAAAKTLAAGLATARQNGELHARVHSAEVIRRAGKAASSGAELSDEDKSLLALLESGDITEQTAHQHSRLTAAQANERVAAYADDWAENGTYAYRFEEMSDGSALAVYVTKAGGQVKYRAFADMAATSSWHPTRAPQG